MVGVAFIGDPEPEVQETICQMGLVASLGRLPMLPDVTTNTLAQAFESIDVERIREHL